MRLEFLGGELLYAMRVVTHGRFNLCPSPVCNPDDGDGVCAVPAERWSTRRRGVPPVPGRAAPKPSTTAKRIVQAAKLESADRVPGDAGRPPRLLRHQRELEPAGERRRAFGLEPVRAGGGLPGRPASLNRIRLRSRALRASSSRLPRRSRGRQRLNQAARGVEHLVHRAIERSSFARDGYSLVPLDLRAN